jgi:ketosteroid isomerase-like protein
MDPETATQPAVSENVQALLDAYEGFNESGEIPVALFDPEVEFVQVGGFAGTGTHGGIAGVQEVLSNLLANFESLKMRPREVLDESDDEILMRVAVTALAKGSRIQVKETLFHIWGMREGRIARWQAFAEEDEAREAFAGEGWRSGAQ